MGAFHFGAGQCRAVPLLHDAAQLKAQGQMHLPPLKANAQRLKATQIGPSDMGLNV